MMAVLGGVDAVIVRASRSAPPPSAGPSIRSILTSHLKAVSTVVLPSLISSSAWFTAALTSSGVASS